MTVETLSKAPTMGSIYMRAAGGRGKKSGGSLPGTALKLAGLKVEQEHLLEYERVCGFAVGDTLPHTYPHILGFPLQMDLMTRKSFPLAALGMVHVSNSITVHRSINASEALDITVQAENLRPHPKGQQVDLVTLVDIAGERVWEGRSTYLARGKANPDASWGEEPPAMPKGDAAAVWKIPAGFGRVYAAASGDVNPIHMSNVSAKALGFPKAIAHGMYTYARVLSTFTYSSGPSTSTVWFKKPIHLPGKVDFMADRSNPELAVAGLRSSRKPETEHLVLTLTR